VSQADDAISRSFRQCLSLTVLSALCNFARLALTAHPSGESLWRRIIIELATAEPPGVA
jgi:hypothetical protein